MNVRNTIKGVQLATRTLLCDGYKSVSVGNTPLAWFIKIICYDANGILITAPLGTAIIQEELSATVFNTVKSYDLSAGNTLSFNVAIYETLYITITGINFVTADVIIVGTNAIANSTASNNTPVTINTVSNVTNLPLTITNGTIKLGGTTSPTDATDVATKFYTDNLNAITNARIDNGLAGDIFKGYFDATTGKNTAGILLPTPNAQAGWFWTCSKAGPLPTNTTATPYELNDEAYYDGTNFIFRDRIVLATTDDVKAVQAYPAIGTITGDTTTTLFNNINTWFNEISPKVLATVLDGLVINSTAIVATDTVIIAFSKTQGQIDTINVWISQISNTVLNTLLSGLNPTNSVIVATDTVRQGFDKTQGQINTINTWIGQINTTVLSTVLTGFTPTSGVIVATDTVIQALNKTQYQLNTIDTWISNFSANVLGVPLTGLSTTNNSAVVATDTLLQGVGKLQAQVNNISAGTITNVTGTDGSVTVTKTGTVVDLSIKNTIKKFPDNFTFPLTDNGTIFNPQVPNSTAFLRPALLVGNGFKVIVNSDLYSCTISRTNTDLIIGFDGIPTSSVVVAKDVTAYFISNGVDTWVLTTSIGVNANGKVPQNLLPTNTSLSANLILGVIATASAVTNTPFAVPFVLTPANPNIINASGNLIVQGLDAYGNSTVGFKYQAQASIILSSNSTFTVGLFNITANQFVHNPLQFTSIANATTAVIVTVIPTASTLVAGAGNVHVGDLLSWRFTRIGGNAFTVQNSSNYLIDLFQKPEGTNSGDLISFTQTATLGQWIGVGKVTDATVPSGVYTINVTCSGGELQFVFGAGNISPARSSVINVSMFNVDNLTIVSYVVGNDNILYFRCGSDTLFTVSAKTPYPLSYTNGGTGTLPNGTTTAVPVSLANGYNYVNGNPVPATKSFTVSVPNSSWIGICPYQNQSLQLNSGVYTINVKIASGGEMQILLAVKLVAQSMKPVITIPIINGNANIPEYCLADDSYLYIKIRFADTVTITSDFGLPLAYLNGGTAPYEPSGGSSINGTVRLFDGFAYTNGVLTNATGFKVNIPATGYKWIGIATTVGNQVIPGFTTPANSYIVNLGTELGGNVTFSIGIGNGFGINTPAINVLNLNTNTSAQSYIESYFVNASNVLYIRCFLVETEQVKVTSQGFFNLAYVDGGSGTLPIGSSTGTPIKLKSQKMYSNGLAIPNSYIMNAVPPGNSITIPAVALAAGIVSGRFSLNAGTGSQLISFATAQSDSNYVVQITKSFGNNNAVVDVTQTTTGFTVLWYAAPNGIINYTAILNQ